MEQGAIAHSGHSHRGSYDDSGAVLPLYLMRQVNICGAKISITPPECDLASVNSNSGLAAPHFCRYCVHISKASGKDFLRPTG